MRCSDRLFKRSAKRNLSGACAVCIASIMTSLLVETSEEDSFLAVAKHIGDLLNEGQVSRHADRAIQS